MLAHISQALMPGAMAAAQSRPGDVAAFVCAMPGKDMAEGARGLGEDLGSLLAEKAAGDAPDTGHDCEDCVPGQGSTGRRTAAGRPGRGAGFPRAGSRNRPARQGALPGPATPTPVRLARPARRDESLIQAIPLRRV